jgi:hypothetical protein
MLALATGYCSILGACKAKDVWKISGRAMLLTSISICRCASWNCFRVTPCECKHEA